MFYKFAEDRTGDNTGLANFDLDLDFEGELGAVITGDATIPDKVPESKISVIF